MSAIRPTRGAVLMAAAALSFGPLCLPTESAQFFFSGGDPAFGIVPQPPDLEVLRRAYALVAAP